MPTSRSSSSTSAPCRPSAEAFGGRLEWRPSRWLIAILVAHGLLAAFAVLASDLPAAIAWPAALAAAVYGSGLAWREARQRTHALVIADDGAHVLVDDVVVSDFAVRWRGPLAFAQWRDAQGRRQRRVWWPDTLPAAARRELRLAVPATGSARVAGSMAT